MQLSFPFYHSKVFKPAEKDFPPEKIAAAGKQSAYMVPKPTEEASRRASPPRAGST